MSARVCLMSFTSYFRVYKNNSWNFGDYLHRFIRINLLKILFWVLITFFKFSYKIIDWHFQVYHHSIGKFFLSSAIFTSTIISFISPIVIATIPHPIILWPTSFTTSATISASVIATILVT